MAQFPKLPNESDEIFQSMKDMLRKITIKDTEFYDVAESYIVLKKLEVRVTPQLDEVKFYKLDITLKKHEYVPQSISTRTNLHKERSDPDALRRVVQLPNIFDNFEKGQICFIGPAGSGKTTLLKTISRDVINGKYEKLKNVEFVRSVKCRSFSKDKKVTPIEFLFSDLDSKYHHMVTLFLKSYPEAFLFVLDSLDSLPYELEEERVLISLDEEAYPATILYNLLTGKLIPEARFITSSRQHTIIPYEGELQAHKIIELVGFSDDGMKEVLNGYLDEAAKNEAIIQLDRLHSVKLLCRTPIFLTFALIGFKMESEFKTSTIAGIMMLFLGQFMRTEHARENLPKIISKLQELAYVGTMEQRVLFNTDELEKYGIKPNEIGDISLIYPRQVLDWDHPFLFCHQSIQETLTALHVAKMNKADFNSFVSKSLHKTRLCVIRRILYGILLDQQVLDTALQFLQEDAEYSEEAIEWKKKCLRDDLRSKLQKIGISAELETHSAAEMHNRFADSWNESLLLLEFLYSINDARQGVVDIIKSSVNKITFSHLPIQVADIEVIGSIISNCTKLNKLNFSNCSVDATFLDNLHALIKGSSVKIDALSLSGNCDLGEKGISLVAGIVKNFQVSTLDLSSCKLSLSQCEALRKDLPETVISSLILGGNQFNEESMTCIGKIVTQSRVKSVDFKMCDLSSKHIENFRNAVEDRAISSLNFEDNTLDLAAGESIGRLVEQCHVDSLDLSYCKLLPDTLKAFREQVENTKVEKLSLRGNVDLCMSVKGALIISDVVKQCKVDSLNLSYCNLTSEKLKIFQASWKCNKISHLSLDDNENMTGIGFSHIGKLVQQCQIHSLDLSYCKISAEDLQKFKKSVEDVKIGYLAFTGSNDVEEFKHQCELIGAISRQCQVHELLLTSWTFDSASLSNLKLSLEGYKMSKLKIMTYSTNITPKEKEEDREKEEDWVMEFSKLITNVKHLLLILKMGFEDKSYQILQTQLDKYADTDMKILVQDRVMKAQKRMSGPNIGFRDDSGSSAVASQSHKQTCKWPGYSSRKGRALTDSILKEEFLRYKEKCCIVRHKTLTKDDFDLIQGCIDSIHSMQCLEFQFCDLNPKLLTSFHSKLCKKISKISICGTDKVSKLAEGICRMVKIFSADFLCIDHCKMSDEDLIELKESFYKEEITKLEELDVSYNKNIGPEGFRQLASILQNCQTRILRLIDCNLTDRLIKCIQESFHETEVQIDELDISYATQLTADGFKDLSSIVELCGIKKLVLSGCQLNECKLASLDQTKIDQLVVSYNSEMGDKEMTVLGSLVKKCGVTHLKLNSCNIEKESVYALLDSSITSEKGSMLQFLNLSDNRHIGSGIEGVAELVKKTNLEELDISDCMLSHEQIDDFIMRMSQLEAKIPQLNLSDPDRHASRQYIASVCGILPQITKKLIIYFGRLESGSITLLQQKLNDLPVDLNLEIWLSGDEILTRKK